MYCTKFSSNRIIVLIAVVITLSSCSLANYFRARHANDFMQPQWRSNEQVIALNTDYLGNKPQIIITVNGTPGFRFVLDSGASLSFLMDTPKIKALNLVAEYQLSLGGVGDENRSPAFKTTVKTIDLGGVLIEDMSFAFMPVSTTPYYLIEQEAIVDGVIGHDLMRHFVWQLDRPNNQIHISRDVSNLTMPADTIEIPANVSFKRFKVPAIIDLGKGQLIEQDMIMDTGSRNYMKINQQLVDNREFTLPGKQVQAADYGLSGLSIHTRFSLPSINIGSATFSQVKTNVVVAGDEDDFWFIGSALLRQYITVLDYPNETMYIAGLSENPFFSRYNLIGLELRKLQNGHFIVKYVMPDFPASQVDFQIGDQITSINKIGSDEISLEQWLSITAEPADYDICRVRPSNETSIKMCFNLRSKPIEQYSIR